MVNVDRHSEDFFCLILENGSWVEVDSCILISTMYIFWGNTSFKDLSLPRCFRDITVQRILQRGLQPQYHAGIVCLTRNDSFPIVFPI